MAYNQNDCENSKWHSFLERLDKDAEFRKMLVNKDFAGMCLYVRKHKPACLTQSVFSIVNEQIWSHTTYELQGETAKQYYNEWDDYSDKHFD